MLNAFAVLYDNTQSTADLVVSHFTLSYLQILHCFYKFKVCGNSVWSEFIGTIFPIACDHFCVSVSHFGDSHNVSNFIIVFAMVIYID